MILCHLPVDFSFSLNYFSFFNNLFLFLKVFLMYAI